MSIEITCPECGEEESLRGVRSGDTILMECGGCATEWERPLGGLCTRCGGSDLQRAPLAIVERSRGTQLSIVGTRPLKLCSVCDAETLRRYHAHRPNPLMPADLPTIGEENLNG